MGALQHMYCDFWFETVVSLLYPFKNHHLFLGTLVQLRVSYVRNLFKHYSEWMLPNYSYGIDYFLARICYAWCILDFRSLHLAVLVDDIMPAL